jgi:transcriptional regulator with XRE-family HTH domain
MNEKTFNTFGEWLFYHRNKRNFTQEELAKKLGVTPQQISNLERGERNSRTGKPALPAARHIGKLAQIFNRPVGEIHALISGIKENVPEPIADEIDRRGGSVASRELLTEQIIQLNQTFLGIPPDKRPLILELVETLQAGWVALAITRSVTRKLIEVPNLDRADEIGGEGNPVSDEIKQIM